MPDPEYTYPLQWFDDMGALALPFAQTPALAVDLATSGLSRDQTQDLAQAIYGSGIANNPQ